MNRSAIQRTIHRLQRTIQLHKLGFTTSEIADDLDVTTSTVRDYYKQLGIEANPPAERMHYASKEIEMLTLDLCDECIFSDCQWSGSLPYCPMQADYYNFRRRPVEGQDEFYGWDD